MAVLDTNDPDYKEYQDYQDYQDYQKYVNQSKTPERGFLGRLGYNTLSSLPSAGALAGGIAGSGAGPIGAVGGAAAGGMAGKSLEQAGKGYFFNERPESMGEQYSQLGEAGINGAEQEVGGQIIGKGISSAASALRNQAGKSAYKALGPFAKDVKNTTIPEIIKKGQNVRDTGIVGGIPTNYQGLADRAENVLETKGPQFDEMTAKIADQSGVSIPKEKIVANIQRELSPHPDIPTLKHTSDQVEELLNQVRSSKPVLTVPEAQNLKSQIGQILEKRNAWSTLKKGGELSTENQFLVSYYHGLNKAVENAGDLAAEKTGGDIGNQWRQLKQDYGTSKEAYRIASTKAGREFVNRFVSPSDYMMGVGGMVAHGNAGGAAIGAANMLGRKFGQQSVSGISDLGANILNKAPSEYSEPLSKEAIGLLKQKKKEE